LLPGTTFGPERILALLWSRKYLIGLSIAAGTAAAYGVSHYLPDQFRSEALIMVVSQRIPESYVKATVTEKVEDRLSTLSDRALSRSRLEQIIHDFDLYKAQRRDELMEQVLLRMRKDVKVTFNKNESLTISYISPSPVLAQGVTERLATSFIQENARDRESLAENTNQFLDSQLDEAKHRLMDHEKKLEEYRRRYSGQLPAQASSNQQVIQSTDAQRQSLADAVNRARERRILIERQLVDLQSPEPEARQAALAQSGEAAQVGQSSEQRLTAARRTLEELRSRKTPDHPDVQAAQRHVRDLEAEVGAQSPGTPKESVNVTPAEAFRERRMRDLKTQMADIDRELKEKADTDTRLQSVVADYQGRLDAVPTRESELVELTRDYDTLQDMYKSLLTKREESKISANLERQSAGEQFTILEPPQLPVQPFRPNRLLIYLGGIAAGLMFGLVLTGLLVYLDSGFASEEDIVRVLSVPVLATIPVMKAGRT
jgi:succinoglycan biosynthesis transport protein ExoP